MSQQKKDDTPRLDDKPQGESSPQPHNDSPQQKQTGRRWRWWHWLLGSVVLVLVVFGVGVGIVVARLPQIYQSGLDDMRQQGYQVHSAPLNVDFRFWGVRATVDDFALVTPDGSVAFDGRDIDVDLVLQDRSLLAVIKVADHAIQLSGSGSDSEAVLQTIRIDGAQLLAQTDLRSDRQRGSSARIQQKQILLSTDTDIGPDVLLLASATGEVGTRFVRIVDDVIDQATQTINDLVGVPSKESSGPPSKESPTDRLERLREGVDGIGDELGRMLRPQSESSRSSGSLLGGPGSRTDSLLAVALADESDTPSSWRLLSPRAEGIDRNQARQNALADGVRVSSVFDPSLIQWGWLDSLTARVFVEQNRSQDHADAIVKAEGVSWVAQRREIGQYWPTDYDQVSMQWEIVFDRAVLKEEPASLAPLCQALIEDKGRVDLQEAVVVWGGQNPKELRAEGSFVLDDAYNLVGGGSLSLPAPPIENIRVSLDVIPLQYQFSGQEVSLSSQKLPLSWQTEQPEGLNVQAICSASGSEEAVGS